MVDDKPKAFNKKMSRRDMLRFSAFGAGSMFLAACVPQTTEPSAAESSEVASAPASTEPSGDLIFWGHDQHPLDLAATGFVEAYPAVNWISPHPADRGAKLQAVLAAQTDCPDVYWMEASQINDLSCVGALLDITEHLKPVEDDYHPLKLAEATQPKDGKYYGWPGDISVSGWYYRQDVLEEAGYGDLDFETWTWDEFAAMSAEFAAQDKYAFVFPGQAWSALFYFLLHQLDGSPTTEDGVEITVASPQGLEAMSIVQTLYESGGGLDVDWWSPPYWTALQEGTLVGDFAAAWAKGFWEAQIKTEEQSTGLWRIAKFPTGPNIKYRTGIWGGATLVSFTCAEHQENAIAFMQYALGSVDGAGLCGDWGIIPAYRPYLTSERFIGGRSHIFGDWPFNEFWASQEPELSANFYRRAAYDPINTAVTEMMPSIMRGEVSVQDGMNQVVELARPDVERVMCT